MYKLFDSEGQPFRWEFKTKYAALQFAAEAGRPDWTVKAVHKERVRKSTERQKKAVEFCESWLQIEFTGDINDFYDVSDFLSEYLDDAKQTAMELECEYNTYRMELYD